MIDRYISINRTLRAIMRHCITAAEIDGQDDGTVLMIMLEYVENDLRNLRRLWPEGLPHKELDWLSDLVEDEFKGKDNIGNMYAITQALKDIEDEIDNHFGKLRTHDLTVTILDLLHPNVTASSYHHFRNGHYRDAIFNGFLAVFDLLRQRSGLQSDGAALVREALSLEHPRLIISTLDTESGENEQKGMIQMLQGAYQGIRNPKAHSLNFNPELDQNAAAQNLVFASLLARRIEDSRVVNE